jgi:cobalt-zinc-cadmium efflux system outer membrane protein
MIITQHRWVWCLLLAGLLSLQSAVAQNSTVTQKPVSLKTPLQKVLNSHSRLTAARRDYAASQYQALGLGRPLYNPEIGGEAVSSEVDEYYLSISQTISTGGKKDARRQLGASGQALVYAEFEQLRHEIVVEILRAQINYKASFAKGKLAQRRSDLMRQFFDTAQKRYDAGDMGQSEVNMARVALATALDQLAEANRNLAGAESALLVASQQRDASIWPDIEETPASLTIPTDLKHIPAVHLAHLTTAVASANASLADAYRKPDPNFEVRAGKEDRDNLIGVTFSVPLFVRNNFSNEHLAALDAENAASIRANALELETGIRLEVLKQAYETALANWQGWQELIIDQLGSAMDLNDRLWKSGEISTSDYLLQLDRLLESNEAGINLRYRVQQIWVDWLDVSATWQQWFTKGELL